MVSTVSLTRSQMSHHTQKAPAGKHADLGLTDVDDTEQHCWDEAFMAHRSVN